MAMLVIKENVGSKRREYLRFVNSAHEKCLIDIYAPGSEGIQNTQVGRETSCGDERSP